MLAVGRFFGVPIYFAPSWLLIALLLTFYYGPVVEAAVAGVSGATAYLVAFGYALLFALCVLAHELGHTAVSVALKLPVRRVVIYLLGGVSEIEQEPGRPRDELLVAVAGPAVSLVITALAALADRAVAHDSLLGVLVVLLFWSNLAVVAFNLLPGLPLDGGRLLRAGVWAMSGSRLTGTRAGAWTGRALAVVVAVGGLILDRGSWGLTAGLVTLLLAGYLWIAAGQALRVAEVMDRLPAVHLDALLRPGLLVPSGISVAEALRRVAQGRARGLVVIGADDRPAAIVDEQRVGAVPLDQRPWTQLDSVARPLEDGLLLPAGLSGQALLDAVRATPASEYLVVHPDGSPAGILATADLVTALRGNTGRA
jgi:Zn-dependent protease